MFDKNIKFVVSGDVECQRVGEELVILDLASEQYFGLNPVGVRLWSLIEAGEELGDLLKVIRREYDVDAHQLETDIQKLLAALVDAGLINPT